MSIMHVIVSWHLARQIYLDVQLCLILCDPVDCSPSVFSVHGILQARILEWVAISSTREYSQPRDQIESPAVAGRFLTTSATCKALARHIVGI